jgi:hypothetical protein
MSPRSSNGSEAAPTGAPRSAVPVSHLCTCQAKLVGEAGACHCRVAPQIVRFSRRGLANRLCGDCRAGRHRVRGRKRPPAH